MEVNPDNCSQPTVSDILRGVPLCIHPPSLPLLPLPLEGIMSPMGSLDAKMPLYSLAVGLFSISSCAQCSQDGSELQTCFWKDES